LLKFKNQDLKRPRGRGGEGERGRKRLKQRGKM